MNVDFNPCMSIYIPLVATNTTENFVKRVFYNLNFGRVSRVDFVKKEQDQTKYMAFVHFEYWYQNESSHYLQERINSTGCSRVVYNDPNYWIIMENKNPSSKNEINLKRQVNEMSRRIKYLELVVGNHARKFFDNDINTKSTRCDVCWVEFPLEEIECPACNYCDDNIVPEHAAEHAAEHEHTAEHEHAAEHEHTAEHTDEHEHTAEHEHADNIVPEHAAEHEHTAEHTAEHEHTKSKFFRVDSWF